MYLLLVLLDLLGIKLVESLEGKLEVGDQSIASRLGEVLAHDHTHDLHLLRVRRHGVCGYDPATLAELMGAALLLALPVCRVHPKLTKQTRHTPCQDPHRGGRQQVADPLPCLG